MNSLLATLLSGSGNNFDYTYSIAAEVGMIEQSDYDWNLASNWQSSTGGLRLGYQVKTMWICWHRCYGYGRCG